MKKRHAVIYQIKDIGSVDYAFRAFDPKKFSFKDYKKVYELDVDASGKLYTDILEELFSLFNDYFRRPADFEGHSMSVSDVVVLDDKAYYCDAFAWSNMGDINEVIRNYP